MSEVCPNVTTEPHLQPLSGESFTLASTSRDDAAQLNIRADSFWSKEQQTFFNVRIFNPNAPSYISQPMDSLYHRHEQEKRRRYDERIREVEHTSFSPLVFSLSGGMGKATQIAYKRLANLLAERKREPYSRIINFIRVQIRLSLLRSAIAALRNTRKHVASTYPDSIFLHVYH